VEEIVAIDIVRRIVGETDLRLVFVPEDVCRDTRTTITAAQRLGIPSLHLLHGFPYGTTNAHDVVTANVVAAYSLRAKQIYESFGAQPERVVVTGNPLWDVYAQPPMPGWKERICAEMEIDPTRPIIEYALTNTHPFSAVSLEWPTFHIDTAAIVLDAFASLARRHADWQFLIRPHPGDFSTHERLAACAGDKGLTGLRIDTQLPYDAVTVADVMLCTHSNLGIEAMLFGKSVINVALDGMAEGVFEEGMGPLFLEDDAVLWARTPADIVLKTEAALLDGAVREGLLDARPSSIERFNYANDGEATERVCTLSLEMMEHPDRFMDPLCRYPELEPAMARNVPKDAKTILVMGRAAEHVAGAVSSVRPDVDVTMDGTASTGGTFDAVLLADPLPHGSAAEETLSRALARTCDGGSIVAAFRDGARKEAAQDLAAGRWVPARRHGEPPSNVGQFCRQGVEVMLSRCDLELASFSEFSDPAGWVFCGRARGDRPSDLGRERRERRQAAEEANARGEARYAEGDLAGAAAAFAEAANTDNETGVYFNNLAAALHALGRSDEAWVRLLDAVHLEPDLQSARDNLRAVGSALGRIDEAERILKTFGSDRPRG
jgi:tetratricopeptide (TPR) repeat protein